MIGVKLRCTLALTGMPSCLPPNSCGLNSPGMWVAVM